MDKNFWATEQEQFLMDNFEKMPYQEIAVLLNRTEKSILVKIGTLKKEGRYKGSTSSLLFRERGTPQFSETPKTKHTWTKEEDALIIAGYKKVDRDVLGASIDRTGDAVQQRYSYLKRNGLLNKPVTKSAVVVPVADVKEPVKVSTPYVYDTIQPEPIAPVEPVAPVVVVAKEEKQPKPKAKTKPEANTYSGEQFFNYLNAISLNGLDWNRFNATFGIDSKLETTELHKAQFAVVKSIVEKEIENRENPVQTQQEVEKAVIVNVSKEELINELKSFVVELVNTHLTTSTLTESENNKKKGFWGTVFSNQ
jgi:hypothetical protein